MLKRIITVLRMFFALLVLFTIYSQFKYKLEFPNFSLVNFFSYFTILSNLFAGLVLILLTFNFKSKFFDSVRDSAVFYMLITGVVYALLLSKYQDSPEVIMLPWANVVLHMVMPFVMVGDWFLSPPKKKLKYRVTIEWLIFPLLFSVYTVIRGYFINWYPYPFFNPTNVGGYAGVLGYIVAILSFALAFGAVIIFAGNLFVKRKSL